ncbi:MAG: ROK family protein [Salinivirgaceae bacterium]|jgi:glucokinase|nr:ROK family protein [Salinivirgaceae bacterium]
MAPTTAQIIGIDLGGTNVRVGLVEDGKVIKHASAKVPVSKSDPEPVLKCIIDTVQKIISDSVVGIGIGLPGVMDKKEGIIRAITNIPSFTNIPIKQIVSDYFNVPVFIDNDVNCFVLGEKFFGAGKNFRNVVGLSLGTGMGTGIITGNTLLEDANGGSGEFGEVPYLDDNIEAYCSGEFFTRALGKTGDEAYELAKAGDQQTLKIFTEFGTHLGKAIHIILLAFDPEIIIIGGSAANSSKYFHEAMMTELNKFVFQNSVKKLKIVYAQEKYSPILGASKLYDI